ncbi:hypothetical protein EMIT0P228_110157 [Pseudomonas brassicacearum]
MKDCVQYEFYNRGLSLVSSNPATHMGAHLNIQSVGPDARGMFSGYRDCAAATHRRLRRAF